MKKILCVIDLSGSAGKVLAVAARIAVAYNARLIVLYPFRLIKNGYRGDIPSLKVKLETEAREKFQLLRKTLPDAEHLISEFLPEIGFTTDRIEAHVKRDNIEMIIIGQPLEIAALDLKNVDLQNLISHSGLPFVIVPAEVVTEASF